MLQSIRFPFHVWITSIFVGPILFLAFELTNSNEANNTFSGILEAYTFLVPLSFLSVPCFLFLWLCYGILRRLNWPLMVITVLLLFISLFTCAIFISFLLAGGWENLLELGNLLIVVSFGLPLAFGVLVYKLDMVKVQSTTALKDLASD